MSKLSKCDKCKKVRDIPKGLCQAKDWQTLSLTTQGYRTHQLDLCPECTKALGIETKEKVQSLGDQLLDIIYEMVEEVSSE